MTNSVRAYSAQDIERLLRIKKLANLGHRLGKLIDLSIEQLDAMLALPAPTTTLNATHNEAIVFTAMLARWSAQFIRAASADPIVTLWARGVCKVREAKRLISPT